MLLRALFLVATLAFGWAESAAAQGHLAVRGQEIVDPGGKPILLRGYNWGRFGKAEEADGRDNAAQGANAVRIPLRWWGHYKTKGVDSRDDAATATATISPENLKTLDDTVRWASQSHLWIILFIDSNCGQNSTQNEEMLAYCDPGHKYPNGHNFWTDPAARAKFIQIWRFIANRYKDTPYLGLFEPLPEPANVPSITPQQIQDFYGEVMNNIRQVAPGIPFLVGGRKYHPDAIEPAYNGAWKDVVYTGNLFYHPKGTDSGLESIRSRLALLTSFRSRHNVPVFVQQVGVRAGDDDAGKSKVKAVLNHLVDNRVGFTYWEYRGSKNEGEYGVLFRKGKTEWETDQAAMTAISGVFKR
jgi:hypothetical protein